MLQRPVELAALIGNWDSGQLSRFPDCHCERTSEVYAVVAEDAEAEILVHTFNTKP